MSDQKPKKSDQLPFAYQFLAGAIAGISELLVMYPLDVVKTRIQLQSNTSTTGVKYKGMFDCLGKIIRQEGARTLYRGITSPIFMEAPKRATKFAFNEKYKTAFTQLLGPGHNQAVALMSGFCAGATEAVVIVPFELVKVQMQDSTSTFHSPLEVVKHTVKTHGIFGLYKGLESTVLRHAFWNCGYFGCIFQVRRYVKTDENASKDKKILNDLIAGTIGGTMGCIFNTPFDVVKSRVQSNTNLITLENGQVVKKYNWAFPSILKIYREEGFLALYKGFIPKIARLGPGGGILLIVFTAVTDFMKEFRSR